MPRAVHGVSLKPGSLDHGQSASCQPHLVGLARVLSSCCAELGDLLVDLPVHRGVAAVRL